MLMVWLMKQESVTQVISALVMPRVRTQSTRHTEISAHLATIVLKAVPRRHLALRELILVICTTTTYPAACRVQLVSTAPALDLTSLLETVTRDGSVQRVRRHRSLREINVLLDTSVHWVARCKYLVTRDFINHWRVKVCVSSVQEGCTVIRQKQFPSSRVAQMPRLMVSSRQKSVPQDTSARTAHGLIQKTLVLLVRLGTQQVWKVNQNAPFVHLDITAKLLES